MRAREILGLTTALLGLAAAPAAASPSVSEYGTFNKPPWSVAAGGDGKVWFTENADPGAVGHMDVTGTNVVETLGNAGGLANNAKPYDIASGEDGALWVTLAAAGGNVVRVATDGTITSPVTSGLTNNAAPHGLTWGPDGHVWFTESASDAVAELDPATGVVQEYAVPAGSAPEEIAAGPDGNLWFTAPGANLVGRVTTAGIVTTWPSPTLASQPWGIAAGSDGALWFTEAGVNKVGRIATDGTITDFTPAGLSTPRGIVAGGDGALWVLSSASSGNIVRVATDQSSSSTSGGLTGNRQPWSGAVGPDGNLWFAEHASAGQVGRVTLAPAIKPSVGGPVADTTAQLIAHVRPNGQATTVHVEYGLAGAPYGLQTTDVAIGNAGTPQEVTLGLAGLTAGTAYHARVVATNVSGTTTGGELNFTTHVTPATDTTTTATPADPVPTVLRPVAPGPGLEKAPALGKSVGVSTVSGTVRVRDAKGHDMAFDGSETLPTGTVVDATHGTVELRTALDSVGHTQTGRFWGSAFAVQQSKTAEGLTVLRLVGTLKCGATTRGAFAAKAKKPTHSLWGSDHHGRFQTRGKGAVATVRGTRWLTQDRCDGTLVRVTSGAVSVRDLHRHKTVTVRAGHSYLARTAK